MTLFLLLFVILHVELHNVLITGKKIASSL